MAADAAPVGDDSTLDVRPNLERDPFDHLADREWLAGQVTRVGVLPNGTVEGRPALVVVILLPDGVRVAGAVPYKAAEAAARALAAVWSDADD